MVITDEMLAFSAFTDKQLDMLSTPCSQPLCICALFGAAPEPRRISPYFTIVNWVLPKLLQKVHIQEQGEQAMITAGKLQIEEKKTRVNFVR